MVVGVYNTALARPVLGWKWYIISSLLLEVIAVQSTCHALGMWPRVDMDSCGEVCQGHGLEHNTDIHIH